MKQLLINTSASILITALQSQGFSLPDNKFLYKGVRVWEKCINPKVSEMWCLSGI